MTDGSSARPARARREMNWVWAIGAPLVRAIMAIVFRVRVEGIRHVPGRGPAILAPNHVSVLDGPALAAVTGAHRWRATRFLIASEIYDTGWGWILRQARQIPIVRGAGDTGALSTAVDAVEEGSCAGIFPEGRVSDDPSLGLQRLRSGITRVAIPSGAPVVPVGIWGTQTAWPRTDGMRWATLLRRPHVALIYGEALRPPGAGNDESPADFRLRLAAAIEEQVRRAQALTEDDA
jgi:1-acyl-sn-glycerol-3-phosphate acyltransferase